MPTLLEKPPVDRASLVPPSDLLRQRHRWERWRGLLFALLAGLTATLIALWIFPLVWQTPESGKIAAFIWAGGLLLTSLAAVAGWRFAPTSLLDTAQRMDRDLTAKNRLEAAAALHGSTSLLAQAQRAETADYLRRQADGVPRGRVLPWLVTAVLLLIIAHLVTLAIWLIPLLMQPPAVHVPPPKPPPPVMPKASILWQSPEPESKANPVEEVPTVALAQSTTGLRNLSLEISVNGVATMSTPLPATPFDQPGKHLLKSSLYMDELNVEPFDVVTYYIRAERITDQKVPATTSDIQFIQVRPFRDDVAQARGSEVITKGQALLLLLKLAELRSIKENFILAHTDLPLTDPVRVKENDRVGKNQEELSAKTQEVVQEFTQEGVSPDIIDLLTQAEAPMDEAAKKILANQNSQALPPQQKALGYIVQVEKFFHKFMADKSIPHGQPGPDDPFKDKQQHELKKRMALAAGQLETLSRNQTKLADDLSQPKATDDANSTPANTPGPAANPPPGTNPSADPTHPSGTSETNPDGSPKEIPLPPTQAVDPFGPDAAKGTFTARQTRVVQGIETLLNGNKALPPPVIDALQEGQKDATTSLQELDQSDNEGARQPAANAAQDLQRAVAEMIKAGDQETKLAMEAGQQKLNDLAQQLRDLAKSGSPDASQKMADMARQIQDVKKQLEDAADKQQEGGSAQGAERLNRLAKAITDQKIVPDLAAMAKDGLDVDKATADANKLDALATQAAQGMATGKPTARDIANLIASLEQSRANLARLAQQAGVSLPAPMEQTGTPPGPSPAQGKSGDQGAGKDQGQQPGQNQGPGPGELPSPIPLPGQSPGQAQGPSPTPSQGQTQSDNPGQGNGQEEGQGQSQGQGTSPGAGSGGSGAPGEAMAGADPALMNAKDSPANLAQAYQDVMAQLKDQAQQTNAMVPGVDSKDLLHAMIDGNHGDNSRHQNIRAILAGGYPGIVGPLDQLIIELKQALAQTQRSDTVKQPNLDEAPPAYRSAVSDYFESMSKNYHPDGGKHDPNNP